jgi:exodeoxyribonuclease VII large subunit
VSFPYEHSTGKDPFSDRRVYTVSELNHEVRALLEDSYWDIWVEGEISNFRAWRSGHWYFTLKDEDAALDMVMFASANRSCRFSPEDGLDVVVRGRLEIYEAGGKYQLNAAHMEPKGIGARQLALQQLTERLRREGLFDEERKQALPRLPRVVGVVTSPDGAAFRDILNVVRRRYANLRILLSPTRVQGEGAAAEIAAAIHLLNELPEVDVMIVGRGGGSAEDLWAFNEEPVARAIAESRIPVISAVGHEVDTTVSDYVADLRAPTPSAAAELVVSCKEEIRERLAGLLARMAKDTRLRIGTARRLIADLEAGRAFERLAGHVRSLRQRLDEIQGRAHRELRSRVLQARGDALGLTGRLSPQSLRRVASERARRLEDVDRRLRLVVHSGLTWRRELVAARSAALEALSPRGVMERGYSIVLRAGAVVRDASETAPGDDLDIRLWRGRLGVKVEEVDDPGHPEKDGGEADAAGEARGGTGERREPEV